MFKIKPILPCPSIKDQVSFYVSLGFKTVQIYTRPNPYAVVSYGSLELHFYGTKRILPNENPQMCYIEVDDVNRVYEDFTAGLKRHFGKIPRSGIPRISKMKYLEDDRRFMMTDVGGNTFYIGTPNAVPAFYRTIESVEYAKNFETLYDLIYSKEDSHSAFNMLEKFFPAKDLDSKNIGDLDLAKILLVALDIHLQRDKVVNQSINDKLQKLFNIHNTESPDWNKISKQYHEIFGCE
ncbi:hypothetical protein [Paenibacillus nasutitermitis]|uniref:Uncharacterized protein n=1 Tax=Paenibacillus nasutitermitis TaxID=1652958 RepID=A0A917E384_9BACL|nr:hypothetical protein [Paenibacillus nasutitermitis]GGD96491.1 hypothetical protein GCM10010911_64030 [Paenibacillus nasutitermitis]